MKYCFPSSYLPLPAWWGAQWLSQEFLLKHRWTRSDGLNAIVKCAGEWRDVAAAKRRLFAHAPTRTDRERERQKERRGWARETYFWRNETVVTSLCTPGVKYKMHKSYKSQIYVTFSSKRRKTSTRKRLLKLKPCLTSVIFLDNIFLCLYNMKKKKSLVYLI